MKIAFFDSGIGGLTVLREALRQMPDAEYFYYADTENAPYGTKSETEVRHFTERAADFLSKFQIDALVLACNTATAVAIKMLRAKYDFIIIGMEPAIKPAAHHGKHKKIVITATSLTLTEQKLNNLIQQLALDGRVEKINLDQLVCFAEKFDFNSQSVRRYLQCQLSKIRPETHNALVLGCTHFIYYRELIQALVGEDVAVLDGNGGTIHHLQSSLQSNQHGLVRKQHQQRTIRFFFSGKEVAEKSPELENLNNLLSSV